MNQRERAAAAERLMLAAFARAADQGAPAPSNAMLAVSLGYDSPGAVVHMMHRLEARGTIRVTRYRMGRVVTIVATGARTAAPADARPHWSTQRRVASRATGAAAAPLSDFAAAVRRGPKLPPAKAAEGAAPAGFPGAARRLPAVTAPAGTRPRGRAPAGVFLREGK